MPDAWADAGAAPDAGPPVDAGGPPLTLIEQGRTEFAIVVSTTAIPAEQRAARELATLLEQVTGVALPVVPESDRPSGRGLYVGHTTFASHHGIDLSSLGVEEWVLSAHGDAVVLTGGRPRGTLYAVFDFLERFAGVRFFAAMKTVVPRRSTLAVPSDLRLRLAPAFAQRTVFMLGGGDGNATHNHYRVRRKLTTNATSLPLDPLDGDTLFVGRPYLTHTHHLYTQDFPPDHPEYFALQPNGSRAPNGPDGQVDFTNAEVRRRFAETLKGYIRRDRADAADAGLPPPLMYDLTPNDNEHRCVCMHCLALAARTGSYAGVVLDFTNDVAAQVATEFPDVTVVTSAYTFYTEPPRGLTPRPNVLVKLAQLGGEWWANPPRDPLRSMAHPVNATARSQLEAWAATGAKLGVHDYWTPWNQQHLWPYANVRGVAETLQLYRRSGMQNVFVENELFGSRLHNFVDLELYVASKLLVEPTLSPEPLIDEFLDGVYGPAAPPMRRLLARLEGLQHEEPGILATVQPADRASFDADFFLEADALLSEAERLAANDPDALRDLRLERVPFDEAMLFLWDTLASSAGARWTFDRASVHARLTAGYAASYAKYGDWGAALRAVDTRRLSFLQRPPATPPQFAGRRVIDLSGPQLTLATGGPARRVPDADAVLGEAWRLDATMPGAAGDHTEPPSLGFYEPTTGAVTTTTLANVPSDERFHLVRVGVVRATPQLTLWAHRSWWLSSLLTVAMQGGLSTQRTFEVYVSLKLEGPGYVPGSTRLGAFSIDRVLLVQTP
jgi:hypothetical protein